MVLKPSTLISLRTPEVVPVLYAPFNTAMLRLCAMVWVEPPPGGKGP